MNWAPFVSSVISNINNQVWISVIKVTRQICSVVHCVHVVSRVIDILKVMSEYQYMKKKMSTQQDKKPRPPQIIKWYAPYSPSSSALEHDLPHWDFSQSRLRQICLLRWTWTFQPTQGDRFWRKGDVHCQVQEEAEDSTRKESDRWGRNWQDKDHCYHRWPRSRNSKDTPLAFCTWRPVRTEAPSSLRRETRL